MKIVDERAIPGGVKLIDVEEGQYIMYERELHRRCCSYEMEMNCGTPPVEIHNVAENYTDAISGDTMVYPVTVVIHILENEDE